MERLNVFAFTQAGHTYPPYLSINVVDGALEITVRSAAKPDGSCGDTASIVLDHGQEKALARTLFSRACTGAA